jgi:hypothetical protein
MSLEINSFNLTTVYWQSPSGDFSRIRVVRNQSGFAETAEDGVIIFEQNSVDGSSLEGLVTTSSYRDGIDNPTDIQLLPGREVYYRVFLFTSNKFWVVAGSVHGILPRETGVTKKLLDLLPRVLTTKDLSPLAPLDAVFSSTEGIVHAVEPDTISVKVDDTTFIHHDVKLFKPLVVVGQRVITGSMLAAGSDLYGFLDGLAFTYETLLTSIELIRPGHSVDKAIYSTIPGEDLHVGLPILNNFPILNQRRLIREALYLYSKRGTKVGIEGYAEALTGYIPTTTVSSNLLLNVQDSTFYDSIGNWVVTGGTLTKTEELEPDLSQEYIIDSTWTGKVAASGSGTIKLGITDPITQGVPILPSTAYTFSGMFKVPTGSSTVTASVQFFDKNGTSISTSAGSGVAGANLWKQVKVTATSPSNASYAVVIFAFNNANTYYFDMVSAQLGSTALFQEARSVDLYLVPKKQNYIHNPSFEVNASTWTVTGATFSQDSSVPYNGYSGDYSGKFVAAGAWDIKTSYPVTVDPGTYFTFSTYVKSPALTEINMVVKLYDVDDNLLNTYTEPVDVATDWTRVHTSHLVSSDSLETYAICSVEGLAGTVYLDMMQFEDTSAPTDYFDGSMPSQFGTIWEGAANASNSYLYPSKPIKMTRLANTLVDWVPLNTFWRITTPAGVEYTNLEV